MLYMLCMGILRYHGILAIRQKIVHIYNSFVNIFKENQLSNTTLSERNDTLLVTHIAFKT